jgi:hypothetical protein
MVLEFTREVDVQDLPVDELVDCANAEGMCPIAYLAEGGSVEVTDELPARFDVCPTCDGKGSHVNPSIDDNGICASDFYEDPDFAESYFAGCYDVPCNECKGKRVIMVPVDGTDDESKALVAAYYEHQNEMASYAAEDRRAWAMGY